MSTRKGSRISAALLRKGFREDDSGHHRLFWLFVDDVQTGVKTYLSHGKKEYSDRVLGKMATVQLGLRKKELLALIDCPMTGEKFVAILEERGRLTRGG